MTAWADLTVLLESAPGEYSACVWNADGACVYGYHEDVARSAASLIKVPLSIAVLDAQPMIDLDERVTLNEADRVEGEGSFDRAPAGTTKTVCELIAHSLIESDNTASNLLIDRVGFDAVSRLAERVSRHTRLQRKFMDFDALVAGRDNLTTAVDMCAWFHHLRQPNYTFLLDVLEQALGDGKLEVGLPPGTRIAHKVGDLPGVEHNAGIVYAPRGLYIVAVLAVRLPDAQTGKQTIAATSRLIWNVMTNNE